MTRSPTTRGANQWGPRKVTAPAAVSGLSPAYDDHGHGTKSSGVAAASTDNSTGIAGMCWLCTIDARKVLDQNNTGLWSNVSSAIVDAAEFPVAENRVGIISMSLSGSSGSTTLENAVKHAHAKNSVVLASAGNAGTTDVRYPSGYVEAIAVAGSDSNDTKYSWSSYGTSWVDIAAPGCNDTTFRGATYGSFCGTSSATPLAAGAAGLLVSLGGKTLVKTHSLPVGTGAVTATLTAKASPLRLRVFVASGVLLSDTQNSSGVPRSSARSTRGSTPSRCQGRRRHTRWPWNTCLLTVATASTVQSRAGGQTSPRAV